ncbi:MAG: ABC transporter ATP-binding protein, partial [Opitutales bacterium]
TENLLEIHNLKMHFPITGGILLRQIAAVKAVDDVSLHIKPGETLGLVGESGCGKSTLGKCAVRLHDPTSGNVIFDGADITKARPKQLRGIRKDIQMIFQDPAESLDPRMSVRAIIEEAFSIQKMGTRAERQQWALQLLDRVGLPSSSIDKFSFEFSGGQRQRIGIARAIALNPKLVIADEPVSALDVSVQSQVLNLLMELQRDLGLAYLFIAHDLAVVKHISDRVAVMYLGKIVELADAKTLYKSPKHAYTKALLSAIPAPNPCDRGQRIVLEGDVPSPIDPPTGSAFGHRIQHKNYEQSIGLDLSLVEIEKDHWVAADPCCLSEEDYKRAAKLSTTYPQA